MVNYYSHLEELASQMQVYAHKPPTQLCKRQVAEAFVLLANALLNLNRKTVTVTGEHEVKRHACVGCAWCVTYLAPEEYYCNSSVFANSSFNRVIGLVTTKSVLCSCVRTEDTCKGFKKKATT